MAQGEPGAERPRAGDGTQHCRARTVHTAGVEEDLLGAHGEERFAGEQTPAVGLGVGVQAAL